MPDWSRYVLGALWLLADRGIDVPPLRIEVDSDVPTGAGLSSSAALVCSVVRAVDAHLGLGLDDDALFVLARAVENDVVGAPTGGMDQLVSLRGVEGHALFCDMRDTTTRAVPFEPAGDGLYWSWWTPGPPPPLRRRVRRPPPRLRGGGAQLGVRALRDVAADDLDAALARLGSEELRRYVRHVVTENARVL